MEIFNRDTLHAPDQRKLSRRNANANREWKSPARSPRLDRPTIGFWVGGGLLGTGGCILGVCMPHHHPVAMVLSALWWGIYLGCFGASVGALIALFTEGAPAPASPVVDGRGLSAAPATIPAACSLPQEGRLDCNDHKPEREHYPEIMDEQADNRSLFVLHPGTPKE
jgi:hypothetical protein